MHQEIKTNDLVSNGYMIIEGNHVPNEVKDTQVAKYWDDLPLDTYMGDGGTYRERRFGCFEYCFNSKNLKKITRNYFYQSKDINPLNGGGNRQFEDVCDEFSCSGFLKGLVDYCLDFIPLNQYEGKKLVINTHLFRVITDGNQLGLPTPEGIHRDGHHFVSQHLIQRKNINGGISGIYTPEEKSPLIHKLLNNSFDTIIVDDNRVKHDVSPIFCNSPHERGVRDMLIIDYKFI
ncbi:2OG-Fe dioxygenase family protein [Vibrio sp. Isolate31]|uniref:2OG-Fe dioxygenase family protein n=1 Tax=unclassified Vibrio TaxID=2614977 RepID=UPI001EFCD1AB|nr:MULTISPECIES: 2OG-Fe dioxygenase family protein [unclassified Vibrio]MCG9554683.1 2OG-Fe dioxygenase family protein [Vibrio sp. Isolate32]MCG9600071.1 2OG-Fe dioxygenase family protein [Vibrio sp. Isolate31]